MKETTITIKKQNSKGTSKGTNKYSIIITKDNLQWTEVIDIVKDEV